MTNKPLTLSHGQLVAKGEFKAGSFIRRPRENPDAQKHFNGTWEELEELVITHQENFTPGTGSVDNDVILITVPTTNFFTTTITIDDSNRHLVREEQKVRAEGEAPVTMKMITAPAAPASHVQIVCYRADVLARDNNRTADAEWEIVAILAQADKHTPMHPTTMHRNTNKKPGGTYREYSQEQWKESYAYWDNHAYANTEQE